MSSVTYTKRDWRRLWLCTKTVTKVYGDPEKQVEVEREVAEWNKRARQIMADREAIRQEHED